MSLGVIHVNSWCHYFIHLGVWVDRPQFVIHSSVDEHLGCLHFFVCVAIYNNSHGQVFVWMFVFISFG